MRPLDLRPSIIWCHCSAPRRFDLFMPRQCADRPTKKKDVVGLTLTVIAVDPVGTFTKRAEPRLGPCSKLPLMNGAAFAVLTAFKANTPIRSTELMEWYLGLRVNGSGPSLTAHSGPERKRASNQGRSSKARQGPQRTHPGRRPLRGVGTRHCFFV